MTLESFDNLECYQAARTVRVNVSQFCRSLPAEERFWLKDQMIRASRSVTAKIAEGFGRHHHQENLQFSRQARGSLYETLEHFHTALDEGYLDRKRHQEQTDEVRTAIRILNGYIKYLAACAKNSK